MHKEMEKEWYARLAYEKASRLWHDRRYYLLYFVMFILKNIFCLKKNYLKSKWEQFVIPMQSRVTRRRKWGVLLYQRNAEQNEDYGSALYSSALLYFISLSFNLKRNGFPYRNNCNSIPFETGCYLSCSMKLLVLSLSLLWRFRCISLIHNISQMFAVIVYL